jgi:hypothetical protein
MRRLTGSNQARTPHVSVIGCAASVPGTVANELFAQHAAWRALVTSELTNRKFINQTGGLCYQSTVT